jgi:SOS-response transcriptional repressor LexA
MEPEIRDRDLIIVDGNLKYPKHGDTVVAPINRKKFHRRARKITLHPLNPEHDKIPVSEDDDFQIQGVVVAITREMRR